MSCSGQPGVRLRGKVVGTRHTTHYDKERRVAGNAGGELMFLGAGRL